MWRLLADAVVVAHLLFVAFVVGGALLVLRWPWIAFFHLPAACWGAVVELCGWVCPLTPLENRLRLAAGEAGYAGSFVDRYLLPIVYPAALTRDTQYILGIAVFSVNLALYWWILRRRRSGL